MNTRFSYLYQDSTGHRYFGERVFGGSPTPELIERLRQAMEPGDDPGVYRFIADQVGLPSLFPWVTDTPGMQTTEFRPERDPVWHEVSLGDGEAAASGLLVSDDEPTDGRAFEQFVRAVEGAAEQGWTAEGVDGSDLEGKVGAMEEVAETREADST